jgi:hypothetical protein
MAAKLFLLLVGVTAVMGKVVEVADEAVEKMEEGDRYGWPRCNQPFKDVEIEIGGETCTCQIDFLFRGIGTPCKARTHADKGESSTIFCNRDCVGRATDVELSAKLDDCNPDTGKCASFSFDVVCPSATNARCIISKGCRVGFAPGEC